MPACNFDDQETNADLEIQIKDYCLSLVPGACAVQTDQVTLFYTDSAASLFNSTRCSDIEEIILDEPEGNRQLYTYNDIEIWVYTVLN